MQIYSEIGEALRNGEGRLILMVPEQFTLQAERDLIPDAEPARHSGCEVLSFTRLAYKVFNEAGVLPAPISVSRADI